MRDRAHRGHIGRRTQADPRHARLAPGVDPRLIRHRVHGKRNTPGKVRKKITIGHARHEEAIGTGKPIFGSPLHGLIDQPGVAIGCIDQEQIGTGIDEEIRGEIAQRTAAGGDARSLFAGGTDVSMTVPSSRLQPTAPAPAISFSEAATSAGVLP